MHPCRVVVAHILKPLTPATAALLDNHRMGRKHHSCALCIGNTLHIEIVIAIVQCEMVVSARCVVETVREAEVAAWCAVQLAINGRSKGIAPLMQLGSTHKRCADLASILETWHRRGSDHHTALEALGHICYPLVAARHRARHRKEQIVVVSRLDTDIERLLGRYADAVVATKLRKTHMRIVVANALQLAQIVHIRADVDDYHLEGVILLRKKRRKLRIEEALALATYSYDYRDWRIVTTRIAAAHKSVVVDTVVGNGIVVELHKEECQKQRQKSYAIPGVVD